MFATPYLPTKMIMPAVSPLPNVSNFPVYMMPQMNSFQAFKPDILQLKKQASVTITDEFVISILKKQANDLEQMIPDFWKVSREEALRGVNEMQPVEFKIEEARRALQNPLPFNASEVSIAFYNWLRVLLKVTDILYFIANSPDVDELSEEYRQFEIEIFEEANSTPRIFGRDKMMALLYED